MARLDKMIIPSQLHNQSSLTPLIFAMLSLEIFNYYRPVTLMLTNDFK